MTNICMQTHAHVHAHTHTQHMQYYDACLAEHYLLIY